MGAEHTHQKSYLFFCPRYCYSFVQYFIKLATGCNFSEDSVPIFSILYYPFWGCETWWWWRLPRKILNFLSIDNLPLKTGCLNPFHWRSLHIYMPPLHKRNENVWIGMTVAGQVCNGNFLHYAAVFLITLAANYWQKLLLLLFFWKSSTAAYFLLSQTEYLQWKSINLSVKV